MNRARSRSLSLSDEERDRVRALSARFAPGDRVVWDIDPADEMFRHGVESVRGSTACGGLLYFLKGHQIASAVREILAWRFGRDAGAPSLLDFGSGWGRVTRFLAAFMPAERIFVADASSEATAFQAAALGVNAVPSSTLPEDFVPGRRFGLVVASSFFSHLPERTFARWLERLWACVLPEGALAFSTHGQELRPSSAAGEDGLVFVAASESPRLDPEEYGTSYVSETFVREVVRSVAGPEARVALAPRGLAGHQDLYVVWKGAASPAPRVTRYPWGDVDGFTWEPAIELSGWCADANPGGRVASVELSVEGSSRDRCRTTSDAPEGGAEGIWRGRWSLSAARAEVGPDDVVGLWAKNAAGLENLIGLGTLRPFLERGGQAAGAGALH